MTSSLTAARVMKEREARDIGYPVAAGVKIYAGAIVGIDPSGFARNIREGTVSPCLGIATNTVDNTAGFDGSEGVVVRRGCFQFFTQDISAADVGQSCYAVNNQTVSKSDVFSNGEMSFDYPKAGTIVSVEVVGTTPLVWVSMPA